MGFLKRHMFIIVCGAVSVAGIALAATGISAMPEVMDRMSEVKRLYTDLNGLQSRPVNQRNIEAEQERIDLVLKDRDRVFAKARELYNHEPLVPEALPDGDDAAGRRFRKTYKAALDKLYESLTAGQPATRAEISEAQAKIEDERARAKRAQAEGETPDQGKQGPPRTAAGVLTKSGARSDAVARANMAAAQTIYCYANAYEPKDTSSDRGRGRGQPKVAALDYDPLLMAGLNTVDAPLPEDVWRAQVGYWIQKDVVEAINAINNEAGKELSDQGERPWVGVLPVKDVISIRVSQDYVLPSEEEFGAADAGGYTEAFPPGTAASVFTRTASNEIYDVRQFSVKLIMDQRDILRLVDKLTANKFHTLLRTAYVVVPPNRDMHGKIYGPEPVVNVVLDFETILLGDVFRPMMPTVVCERLAAEGYGLVCPERESGTE